MEPQELQVFPHRVCLQMLPNLVLVNPSMESWPAFEALLALYPRCSAVEFDAAVSLTLDGATSPEYFQRRPRAMTSEAG